MSPDSTAAIRRELTTLRRLVHDYRVEERRRGGNLYTNAERMDGIEDAVERIHKAVERGPVGA